MTQVQRKFLRAEASGLTPPTKPGNNPIEVFRLIAFWQSYRNLRTEAFYGVTSKAAEMEMVVRMLLVATPLTERKVLLPVVRNYAVGNAVRAETVEDAVDRRSVYTLANRDQNFVVAQGGTRLFKGGQDGGFGWRISAFHDLLLRRRCNNKEFSVVLQ
jgi:hypothetical protein